MDENHLSLKELLERLVESNQEIFEENSCCKDGEDLVSAPQRGIRTTTTGVVIRLVGIGTCPKTDVPKQP